MKFSLTSFIKMLIAVAVLATLATLLGWFPEKPASNLLSPDEEAAQLKLLQERKVARAERARVNETVWSKEVLAQEYEQTVVNYWDQMLRPQDDKFAVLASIPFETITLPRHTDSEEIDHGIIRTEYRNEGEILDREGWQNFLQEMQRQNYTIHAIEFHQKEFDLDANGNATSVFSVPVFVSDPEGHHRWAIDATVQVDWSREVDESGLHVPRTVSIRNLTILEREAPQTFEARILQRHTRGVVPIAYDLNRDGLSEILLPETNTVHWNRGGGVFEGKELFKDLGAVPSADYIDTGIVADFTNDGYADLLCALKMSERDDLPDVVLFRGNSRGRFDSAPESALDTKIDIRGSMVGLTAGDIEGDGDLDVWLLQYRDVYDAGRFPTPYFDANDGYPSYLLVNNGDGTFSDGTEAANLTAKRNRRTFAASFVDMDDDADFDLVVVNDFAGVDIHLNDGTGRFTDETDRMVDERHSFGMGHTYADFDLDGKLDFYVTGMASTTARRLESMGLAREEFPEYTAARMRMATGNRMYMGRDDGTYHEPGFKQSVARTGWAWGVTSLDFDCDGDMDVYVANGHQTGKSSKDYCTNFWCHDIYSAGSDDAAGLVLEVMRPLNNREESWDGYQKNNLLMNLDGTDFINVAFLMDVALVNDSRGVVSDDFDADGRPDLLVKTVGEGGGSTLDPTAGDTYLLENRWPGKSNWIGVRLQEEPGRPSPIGAKIVIEYDNKKAVARIVTGDSVQSQHANIKHFGLGDAVSVEAISVTWPNGIAVVIEDPAVNEYHLVRAGKKSETAQSQRTQS